MDVRRKYVGVVLLSALIVGFESVAVEGALRIADISIFLVSSMPSIIGGTILLGAFPAGSRSFVRGLGTRGWSGMIVLCALVAGGVFMWFDAVGRIGASKEAILGGGSSEVLFIVILSVVFLKERLNRWEMAGSLLVIVGVFIVLANTETLSFTLGLGELEAIGSSLILGVSVVLTTMLLKEHDLTALSGLELLLSGIFMVAFAGLFGLVQWPSAGGWGILLLMGMFPAVGLWTYNSGLPKIGASMTSVLFALNGVMTVGAQLLVLCFVPDADLQLPQSLVLAVTGGAVAFGGVYLLNREAGPDRRLLRKNGSAEGEI